jgi:hypothetical protein
LEIGADSNSDQVLLQIANTLKLKKREKRKGEITLNKRSAMPCTLCCYFYFSYLSLAQKILIGYFSLATGYAFHLLAPVPL